MSSTYAGNDVYPEDFLVPDDGDDESASPVNIPDEAIADRTTFLRNRGGGGALASLAALTAITTPSNGWMRFVKNYGYFLFDSASALTVASPYILRPDDLTAGRWLHELLALRNLAAGVAGLDANKQLTIFDDLPSFPVFEHTRTVNRAMPTHGGMYRNASTGTLANYDKTALFEGTQEVTGDYHWNQGSMLIGTVNGGAVCYRMNDYLVDGSTLSSVLVNVQGPAHLVMPAHRMAVGLFRRPINSSALSTMVTGVDWNVDPNSTDVAYSAPHGFVVVPDTLNVIDKSTNDYYLIFWGETGSDSLPTTKLQGIKLTMSAIADMRFP